MWALFNSDCSFLSSISICINLTFDICYHISNRLALFDRLWSQRWLFASMNLLYRGYVVKHTGTHTHTHTHTHSRNSCPSFKRVFEGNYVQLTELIGQREDVNATVSSVCVSNTMFLTVLIFSPGVLFRTWRSVLPCMLLLIVEKRTVFLHW